jgi:hypothetical protein
MNNNKEFKIEELESRLEMLTCSGTWGEISCPTDPE